MQTAPATDTPLVVMFRFVKRDRLTVALCLSVPGGNRFSGDCATFTAPSTDGEAWGAENITLVGSRSRAATEAEISVVKAELESLGYQVEIVKSDSNELAHTRYHKAMAQIRAERHEKDRKEGLNAAQSDRRHGRHVPMLAAAVLGMAMTGMKR